MGDHPTIPAPETQEFETTVTMKDGHSVVIKVVYPKHHAMVAIQALGQFGLDNRMAMGLLSVLRHDPSVAAWMKEQGLGFADDDDEDFLDEDDLDVESEEDAIARAVAHDAQVDPFRQ